MLNVLDTKAVKPHAEPDDSQMLQPGIHSTATAQHCDRLWLQAQCEISLDMLRSCRMAMLLSVMHYALLRD